MGQRVNDSPADDGWNPEKYDDTDSSADIHDRFSSTHCAGLLRVETGPCTAGAPDSLETHLFLAITEL
jgi:hypothetical protein